MSPGYQNPGRRRKPPAGVSGGVAGSRAGRGSDRESLVNFPVKAFQSRITALCSREIHSHFPWGHGENMATTFILVDAKQRATLIPAGRIQAEATARMVRGEKFEIYRAEPMKLEINIAPAPGPTQVGGGGRGRRAPTARRKTATRAASRGGARRVGRPKVNVGPCTVPGCKRTAKTRGLCSAHYQQHRRLVRQGKPGLMGASAQTGKAPKAAPRRPRPPGPRGRRRRRSAPPRRGPPGRRRARPRASRPGRPRGARPGPPRPPRPPAPPRLRPRASAAPGPRPCPGPGRRARTS